jgi:polar amino acid transport system substrate-binding protein
LLARCSQEGDTWESIAASGVLRVGVDPTFPPFALAEGTEVEGLDIDLGRALAEEMGLEAQFTYFGYDGLYDALATGQVDVLISALVVAPERTRDVAYTAAYFDAGQFLVVTEDLAGVDGMEKLDGRTVAVELGALGHVEALEWQARLDSLTVQTHGSADEALAAVAAGEADAALVDSVSGLLFLREQSAQPRLLILARPVASEPYAIATRIEDRTLQRELDIALNRLFDSGQMEAILERWLGPDSAAFGGR